MKKLWIENIALPNVEFTDDDLSATHTDFSNDVEKWNEYGLQVLQWMHVRRRIQPLVHAASTVSTPFDNWANVSSEIKSIAIEFIVVPYALRVPTITDEEDQANWKVLMQNTRGINEKCNGGRPFIIELMRERAADNIRTELWDYDTADQFYYDTANHITAFEFANSRDLIEWITNEVGSQYENDGFAQKSYFTTELKNDLVNIYNEFY